MLSKLSVLVATTLKSVDEDAMLLFNQFLSFKRGCMCIAIVCWSPSFCSPLIRHRPV